MYLIRKASVKKIMRTRQMKTRGTKVNTVAIMRMKEESVEDGEGSVGRGGLLRRGRSLLRRGEEAVDKGRGLLIRGRDLLIRGRDLLIRGGVC